jgi:hypothetical protein
LPKKPIWTSSSAIGLFAVATFFMKLRRSLLFLPATE